MLLGAVGAALFYGDAIITPALSVLSAVEGLKSVPGLEAAMTLAVILALTIGILVGLFAVQSRGTASVARLFGPVCVIWFVGIAALGVVHIADEPAILLAFNPFSGVAFLGSHGVTGLFVLGAVFLTVTGAEALIADMGHFGRGPIQIGWLGFVWPALTLNYLGQGALALAALDTAQAAGRPFANADWFFLMAPDAARAACHAGHVGDDHRQPGGDHRRLFADPPGDRAGPAAADAIRQTSASRSGRSTCRRSTGCCWPAWWRWFSPSAAARLWRRPMASR